MKAKIIIDGKECEIVLTEDQQTEIEKISKKPVKRWEDLGRIRGYYIDDKSIIRAGGVTAHDMNRNSFTTENQAKGVLAMSQLSQLMKDVNGDWKPEWKAGSLTKDCIVFRCNKAVASNWSEIAQFLAFPTAEIRDQFLEDHKELIETYFLIYQ